MEDLHVRIKYFEGATHLEAISIGDWIDVYARKDVVIPVNTAAYIPLGFAMQLPQGYEAHLAPRSSTFKKWGIIQVNSVGVIDSSYCGDGDEWLMPVYCLKGNNESCGITYTKIKQGDKIGQFRILKKQPKLAFDVVETLGNEDRGGFGSTGTTKYEEK